MDHQEQENRELKEEVARLSALMESFLATQSQSSPTPSTPPQRTFIYEIISSTVPATSAHFAPTAMPAEFSWGMPPNFMPEGPAPTSGGPNVKKNPLPEHGKSVNMVQGCPGKYKVKYVSHIRQSLVEMHRLLCDYSHYEHDHDRCRVCSVNQRGCRQVRKDVQEMLDEGVIEILQNRNVDEDEPEVNVISPVFRIPEPVIIKYDENGKEVSLPSSSVVNIADVSCLTRSGRVFSAPPKPQANADSVERPIRNAVSTPNPAPVVKPSSTLITSTSVGPSGNVKENCDEMLRLIKRSEYNVVLDVAYVDHDVTIEQFDSIIANITACNNLSFCDFDLPEVGKDHNLALHISMNCKDNAMSNVLVDTGSSLNVLPKSTLSKLSYQGPPMRQSGVVVKAFDGSHKTVIGEVDLPIKIGPSDFWITF
ncbi:hypothetical protein KIW84_010945 [Lathyrus oleraceus]|uniref:Uncharacterized protein n=1 Tax=Pisum sativum TaxID=3888 RepID=A0A9D4YLF1_PEA|nr:hypothetical protein KIW84_010945 [Pisum sativum]